MKTFEVSHVQISGKQMVRDLHSKAVLNTDLDGLRAYKDKQLQMQEIKASQERLTRLEDNMQEIKNLLGTLVAGINAAS